MPLLKSFHSSPTTSNSQKQVCSLFPHFMQKKASHCFQLTISFKRQWLLVFSSTVWEILELYFVLTSLWLNVNEAPQPSGYCNTRDTKKYNWTHMTNELSLFATYRPATTHSIWRGSSCPETNRSRKCSQLPPPNKHLHIDACCSFIYYSVYWKASTKRICNIQGELAQKGVVRYS